MTIKLSQEMKGQSLMYNILKSCIKTFKTFQIIYIIRDESVHCFLAYSVE